MTMAGETVNEILAQALNIVNMSQDTIHQVRDILQTISIDKKVALAYQLKNSNTSKIKSSLETFLSENQLRPPSLRSGSVRRLGQGEYRILAVGEELPFDLTLEEVRPGGLSVVRKIISGNETMALKTLQADIDEKEFKKEFAILKPLEHIHVCCAVASLKDQFSRFHIVLKPWCEVYFPRTGLTL